MGLWVIQSGVMDLNFQLSKSELLQSQTRPAAAAESNLSEQTWTDWAKEHKVAVGVSVVVGAAALAVGGVYLYRGISNRILQKAETAGADALASTASQRIPSLSTNSIAKALEQQAPRVIPKVEAPIIASHGLPIPTKPPLEEISPGKVVSGAYTWGEKAAGGLDAAPASILTGDSRALLAQVASGNTKPMVQQLEQRISAEELMAVMRKVKPLSGPALQQREAQLTELINSNASRQEIRDWLVTHSIHDQGTVWTHGIVDGKVTRELLGTEIAQGSRPLIEEMIVDVQRSTAPTTFSRHMPALSRFEMPALSVNRRPRKELF